MVNNKIYIYTFIKFVHKLYSQLCIIFFIGSESSGISGLHCSIALSKALEEVTGDPEDLGDGYHFPK